MSMVQANENPILLEEVLDEGLIDILRQGANYLKDRNEVRKFNRFSNDVKTGRLNLSPEAQRELKLKSYYAQNAQNRTNAFKGYMKNRFSKEGRAINRAYKYLKNDPNQAISYKDSDNNTIFNPYDKNVSKARKEQEKNLTDDQRIAVTNWRLDHKKQRQQVANDIIQQQKEKNKQREAAEQEVEKHNQQQNVVNALNNIKNQRASQIKPAPDVNAATDINKLNQQAKNQFKQNTQAAYNKPVVKDTVRKNY